MKTVGAFEAKTHVSQLLEDVGNGEVFTITKHGVPVARLVPMEPPVRPDLKEIMEAWEEYRDRRHITLGDSAIRELIEEGRK
jgi:prevent-host-death family protein